MSQMARLLIVGLVIALAAVVIRTNTDQPAWAAGATQNDKLLMTTGFLDDSGEAVFVLDALTGDLKGFRVHPSNGRFNYSFFRNIAADFGLDKVKGTPLFTMTTGTERFSRRGTTMPAPMILYIAEATTGKMVAYTIAWNPAIRTRPSDISRPLPITPLDGIQFRGDILRNPPLTE